MQIISYTEARNNLKEIMDMVCADFEPTAITRRNGEPVVMLPLSTWNQLDETMYLKSSSKNHSKLMKAIKEVEQGKILKKKLIEEQ